VNLLFVRAFEGDGEVVALQAVQDIDLEKAIDAIDADTQAVTDRLLCQGNGFAAAST